MTNTPTPDDAHPIEGQGDDVGEVSATSHCQNCGTRLAGTWCHACGQKAMPALRLWLVMLSDSMLEFLAPDGKLARTVVSLLIRPGELSNTYLRGRRIHFINPIRIYIVLSLLYFLGLSIQNTFVEPEFAQPEPEEREWLSELRLPLLSDTQNESMRQYLDKQIIEAIENPGELMAQVYDIGPILIVLLLPLNAMFAKVLFWTARRYFVEHMIVSLHALSFFYLALILQQVINTLPSMFGFIETLIDFWIVIYLYLLLYRVYGGRHRTLVPRYILLLILNGIFTALLFGVTYVMGLLLL